MTLAPTLIKQQTSVALTRARIAETVLELDGKPFSLDDFPFYRPIYNGNFPMLLMKCGRQVAKSTTGSNLIITDSIGNDFFKTLYVAPSMNQAFEFSNQRLQKMISYSGFVSHEYTSPQTSSSVRRKEFTNGSVANIAYALDDPDRIRGISSDRNVYDEVQDIIFDAVVPVVNECMANSDYGWVFYAGTPKSMENNIELLWQQSSQDEWCIPCEGCNKWNFVDNGDSIGKRGIICVKCGKYLNTRHPNAQWISLNPGAEVRGFHISQLILPKNNEPNKHGEYARWNRILYKYETYPESRFKNEVLGISDALGTRLVSRSELFGLCRNYNISREPDPEIFKHVSFCVAGIDWSGGGSSTFTSRTVVHIWGVLPDGRLKTMFYHVFQTGNAAEDVSAVIDICQKYNCQMIVGDAGVGAVPNSMLLNALGRHRVVQAQYGALSSMFKWNKKDRYLVDRTSAIDTMMMHYKRGKFVFCNARQMEQAIDDILAEYEEVTKRGDGRKIWTHSPLVPDDCLHAQLFGWLAAEIALNKVEFYPEDTI
jgi:hypothetical protein